MGTLYLRKHVGTDGPAVIIEKDNRVAFDIQLFNIIYQLICSSNSILELKILLFCVNEILYTIFITI